MNADMNTDTHTRTHTLYTPHARMHTPTQRKDNLNIGNERSLCSPSRLFTAIIDVAEATSIETDVVASAAVDIDENAQAKKEPAAVPVADMKEENMTAMVVAAGAAAVDIDENAQAKKEPAAAPVADMKEENMAAAAVDTAGAVGPMVVASAAAAIVHWIEEEVAADSVSTNKRNALTHLIEITRTLT